MFENVTPAIWLGIVSLPMSIIVVKAFVENQHLLEKE